MSDVTRILPQIEPGDPLAAENCSHRDSSRLGA